MYKELIGERKITAAQQQGEVAEEEVESPLEAAQKDVQRLEKLKRAAEDDLDKFMGLLVRAEKQGLAVDEIRVRKEAARSRLLAIMQESKSALEKLRGIEKP